VDNPVQAEGAARGKKATPLALNYVVVQHKCLHLGEIFNCVSLPSNSVPYRFSH